MGGLPSGAMLAVQVGETDLASRLARHPALAIAAVNGPSSCVASGAEAEIARLEQELEAAGVAHRRVHTSHAFHSAMMDPILDPFEAACRRVHLQAPSIPFLSNVTGGWISDEQAIDPAYWAGHVRRTVRFASNVSALAEDPSRVLLEVGPGTSLASLAKQQAGPEAIAVASLRHPRDGGDDEVAVLEALGKLWCAGVDVDWSAFHEGYDRRRIPLPTYSFERRKYWIEAGSEAAEPAGTTAPAKNPDLGEWFYAPGWKRSLPRREATPGDSAWMIFDDGSELAAAVVDLARSRGGDVVIVRPGAAWAREEGDRFRIDPRRREHYEELMQEVRARGRRLWRVAHLWCADATRAAPDSDSAQDSGFFSLLHLFQAIGAVMGGGEFRVAAVAGGIFDVTGEAVLCPERATLVGACRVAPQEYPGLACRLVDVTGSEAEEGARCVAVELDSPDDQRVVAWRGGHRWVPSYERIRLEPVPGEGEPWGAGEAFLLTGGTGPLELGLAARLLAAGAKGVAFLECEAGAESSVQALRAGGAAIHCSPARVNEREALAAAVAEVRDRFGRLDAVFHTAGAIGGGMIQLKEREAAWSVLSPRLQGARFLSEQLRDGETLVLFSSAISATGVFGQVDYCAASAYLDAFAHSRRPGSGPRVLAIDWGTAHWDRWQGTTGLGSEALLEQLRAIQDAVGITVEEGVEALRRALTLGVPQLVVSPQDLEELVAQSGSSSVAEFLEEIGGASESAAGREGREVVALATDTERQVAGVWSRLLGIGKIGRNDSFFDLGGNSLLAIQLASQLRKEFDIDLTIASLFESADLASLAAAVDAAGEERRQAQEVARVLAEIEGLSEEEIRSELGRGLGVEEAVS